MFDSGPCVYRPAQCDEKQTKTMISQTIDVTFDGLRKVLK